MVARLFGQEENTLRFEINGVVRALNYTTYKCRVQDYDPTMMRALVHVEQYEAGRKASTHYVIVLRERGL